MPRYENKGWKNDPIPNFKMFFWGRDEEPISRGDLSRETCSEFLNYVCKRGNTPGEKQPLPQNFYLQFNWCALIRLKSVVPAPLIRSINLALKGKARKQEDTKKKQRRKKRVVHTLLCANTIASICQGVKSGEVVKKKRLKQWNGEGY